MHGGPADRASTARRTGWCGLQQGLCLRQYLVTHLAGDLGFQAAAAEVDLVAAGAVEYALRAVAVATVRLCRAAWQLAHQGVLDAGGGIAAQVVVPDAELQDAGDIA